MGQRFQAYIKVPAVVYNDVDGKPNVNNEPSQTYGIHHQWCYGFRALRLSANVLRFWEAEAQMENVIKDNSFSKLTGRLTDTPDKALAKIFGYDPEFGYMAMTHDLGEFKNPYLGDNNDGIFVVDLENWSNPKYCFYTLEGISTGLEAHQIVSASDYALSYHAGEAKVDTELQSLIGEEMKVFDRFPEMTYAELHACFEEFPDEFMNEKPKPDLQLVTNEFRL
jgi:hypothetical protein